MSSIVRHALLACALVAIAGCQESQVSGEASNPTSSAATPPSPAQTQAAAPTPASDLLKTDKAMEVALPGDRHASIRYTDLKVGDGSIAEAGKVVMVHYTGWLTDGSKFDSSRDRDRPLNFKIGNLPREVIEGWDRGIRGMRVGGRRKLVIPPELGYAHEGYPPVIPPDATLVFDVELVGIQ